jgi:hypothetical protein
MLEKSVTIKAIGKVVFFAKILNTSSAIIICTRLPKYRRARKFVPTIPSTNLVIYTNPGGVRSSKSLYGMSPLFMRFE